ncbi:MAG: ABC transporter permease [Myxococcota bacterium]
MRPIDVIEFSWTALTRHRRRSLLSVLGITVGVASVVVLTAGGEGAQRFVAQEFASLGTNLLMVMPGRNETTGALPGVGGVPNDLTLGDVRAIRRDLRGVRLVVPSAIGNDTVANGERRRQVAVVGTTAGFREVRKLQMAAGRFLPANDLERGAAIAVIGSKVARELFGTENPVGRVLRVGGWRMRVVGVVAPKGRQLGLDIDDMVMVPVATAMRIFDLSSLGTIYIETHSHADVDLMKKKVLALLAERHGEDDVSVITPDTVLGALNEILVALTLAVAGIGAIALAVAGLGVMNLMLVSVSERTVEVGLLRAIGATRKQVQRLFFVEAVLLSLCGAVIGIGLGWAAVQVFVAFYPEFPASPPAWAVASVLVVALAGGAVFGVLPARRATDLDPVDALSGK